MGTIMTRLDTSTDPLIHSVPSPNHCVVGSNFFIPCASLLLTKKRELYLNDFIAASRFFPFKSFVRNILTVINKEKRPGSLK